LQRRNTVKIFSLIVMLLFSHRIFLLLVPAVHKLILQEVEKISQEARGTAVEPVPEGDVGASWNRR
jgi:hypothetical protein